MGDSLWRGKHGPRKPEGWVDDRVGQRKPDRSTQPQRRQSLLTAINAHDLYRIIERVDGKAMLPDGPMSAALVRAQIFNNWQRYAEELRRWAVSTIEGE